MSMSMSLRVPPRKKKSHFVSSKESFYFSLAILEPSVICEEILTQISSSYSLRPLVGGSSSSFVVNLSVTPRKKLKPLKTSILPEPSRDKILIQKVMHTVALIDRVKNTRLKLETYYLRILFGYMCSQPLALIIFS